MKVWIVFSELWGEDSQIESVYASRAAALAAHPAPKDMAWRDTADGGCYQTGSSEYGDRLRIEGHEVR